MATDTGVVGNQYIRGFMQGAVLKGYDPRVLLEKAGISPNVYDDPGASIDGVQFGRLEVVIQQEMNDMFMGFLEQPAKLASAVEQIKVRHMATTFGEAIRTSTQFREAIRNDVSYRYIIDNPRHEFTLEVHYQLKKEIDERLFYWHRLMTIYRFFSWLIGNRIKLNRICLSVPQPESERGTGAFSIFNCEVRFGQPTNSLTFDTRYLHLPVARTMTEYEDYIAKYPDWFVVPGQDHSWARQTEQVLLRMRDDAIWSPSISDVGKILNVSARTLRRQLARENENFLTIKARVRCELAIKLLLTTDLPITTIAGEVGYSEPGDFTRAFIGWTHSTPSAYRSKHTGDQSLAALVATTSHVRRSSLIGA